MPKGGRKAVDNKPRAGGPGALSRRTDLDGTQPIRAPGGMDYGDRGQLEAAQQAAPLPEGGPLGEGMPSGPTMNPDDAVGMLGDTDTARPDEDIMVGAETPQAAPLAPRELIEGVEYLIQTLDAPSQDLVDFYLELRGQEL